MRGHPWVKDRRGEFGTELCWAILSMAGLSRTDVERALAVPLDEFSDTHLIREQLGLLLTEVLEASSVLACPHNDHVHAQVEARLRLSDLEGPEWLAVANLVGSEECFRDAAPLNVDDRFAADADSCFEALLNLNFDAEDRLESRLASFVPDHLVDSYEVTTPQTVAEQLFGGVSLAALTRVVIICHTES